MTAGIDPKDAFVRKNTAVARPPLVPEIALYQATEITPIWHATESFLEELGLEPPFWAFAWAGGQALARHLLDHPDLVRGKRVLDFAAGSGLAGIAALMAGAARVEAVEIDAYAAAAIRLNAALNGVSLEISLDDIVDAPNPGWDVVLAGDVCYERAMAGRVFPWLRRLAGDGALVLMGDPNRTYLPKDGLTPIARYAVETTRAIEDTDVRNAVVWQIEPE
ncbi:MAG: 50S ribosomal protein L11 methyltransferase [Proteobacteria bacterium]|nr:50S ribosomal protein L11 methyltransferase [Pseudomonadota bacterium]